MPVLSAHAWSSESSSQLLAPPSPQSRPLPCLPSHLDLHWELPSEYCSHLAQLEFQLLFSSKSKPSFLPFNICQSCLIKPKHQWYLISPQSHPPHQGSIQSFLLKGSLPDASASPPGLELIPSWTVSSQWPLPLTPLFRLYPSCYWSYLILWLIVLSWFLCFSNSLLPLLKIKPSWHPGSFTSFFAAPRLSIYVLLHLRGLLL